MATIVIPYVPSPVSTSTTTETFTTTTAAPCTVTLGNGTITTNPKKTVVVPGAVPSSNRPAYSNPTHLRIITKPTKGKLLYPDGSEVTGSVPFNISYAHNGRISYEPSEVDFDSDDSIQLAVVTGCGTSNTATITVKYKEAPEECNCAETSTTSTSTTTT